jgi:hypothetical protein
MERLGDQVLAHLRPVRVGRVDQVDAELDDPPEEALGLVRVVRRAPDARPRDPHGAESEALNLELAADREGVHPTDASERRIDFADISGNANGTPPAYLDLSTCSRWSTWQAAGAYGTGGLSPANIYPLDGNRFVPGFDPAHLGGDTWSADAAIRVIQNDPTWHGMMVSLDAIDKMGHMWGPEDTVTGPPGSDRQVSHLPFAARNADAQVGRIVDALENRGLLDNTLIVITADHAAQTGTPGETFFGDLNPIVTNPPCGGIRSDCNWYFGAETRPGETERYLDPSPAVEDLGDALAGNLAFSYQDGHVAAWLTDNSDTKKEDAAEAVLDMPGVIASYSTNDDQDDYELVDTNPMSRSDRSRFLAHAGELVDTMAAPNGPDVVGLVATDVTYGVVGDHGGHNHRDVLDQLASTTTQAPWTATRCRSGTSRPSTAQEPACRRAGASGSRLRACGTARRCAA